MYKLCKINVKTSFGIVAAAYLLILTFHVQASAPALKNFGAFVQVNDTVPASTKKDTVSVRPAKLLPSDSATSRGVTDSVIRVDTLLAMSKDSVDAIIKYHAEDSGIMIMSTKQLFLYGKAKTDYKDLNLEAATIQYDQESQTVKAYGALDSTGNPLSKPQFTQGEMKTVSDSIFYSLQKGKGLTKNTFFQEGEIFLNARLLKKINAEEVFAQDARFTTCNLDTPHFAFRAKKMKIVNNKLGVT